MTIVIAYFNILFGDILCYSYIFYPSITITLYNLLLPSILSSNNFCITFSIRSFSLVLKRARYLNIHLWLSGTPFWQKPTKGEEEKEEEVTQLVKVWKPVYALSNVSQEKQIERPGFFFLSSCSYVYDIQPILSIILLVPYVHAQAVLLKMGRAEVWFLPPLLFTKTHLPSPKFGITLETHKPPPRT